MMFKRRVSFGEKMFFTKHLAVMLRSGIPISDVLGTLTAQAKSGAFRNILKQIHEDVSRGKSLESAFSKHEGVFDSLYLSLIRIGEESGTLEESLAYLTEQLEKENDLRKKVRSATLYPALVLSATGVIGLALALFVLPQVTELFEDLDVTLPSTTRLMMFVARIIRDYGLVIAPVAIAALFAIVVVLRLRAVKPVRDAFILKLPIVGNFLKCITLAALTRNMGIMLRSGLPVTSVLATAAAAEQNAVYRRRLEDVAMEVKKGKGIGKTLQEGKYVEFPPFASRMIEVGEKSGNLEENLLYLGEYFEAEVDDAIKNMTTILEPVLLLLIGAVVGFVALAIISPIYQVTGSIR
jgi:type II secretory pathway component PulF